jgi:hypothetical protein
VSGGRAEAPIICRSSLLVAVALTISHATMASAQDPGLVTPQPEHRLLERLAGDWQFERQSVPRDGATPQTLGTGTISAELVGDFFVVSRWSGAVYGAGYKAVQSLGYDFEQNQYAGYWIDSFLNFRWELAGRVDDVSQELTMTTRGPAPAGGTAAFRERYQFTSADAITIIGEMQHGEHWVALTVTRLTRRR